MKAFFEWLLAHRLRLVLLAAATAPLLPLVATALLALETARKGPEQGLLSAALAIAAVLVIALATGANAMVLASLGVVVFGSGILLGALLIRGGGSLTLAFQAVFLLFALLVAVLSTIGPDPRVMLAPVLEQVTELLTAQGTDPQQLEAMREWEDMLIALLFGFFFVNLVTALLLAHWWLALAAADVRFGEQFRALKLGLVLGIPAMAMPALGLVTDLMVVQNLTFLALFAFLFQGLAVLHAWAHARKWHPLFVAPVYVLLLMPLTGLLVLLGLSSIGLVDNLFDLRAPLRANV